MAAKPDLTEFFKYSRPKKKPCQIAFAREQLKPQERDNLNAALDADQGIITAGAIIQWLSVRGHTVSAPAVTAHRKRTCTCDD